MRVRVRMLAAAMLLCSPALLASEAGRAFFEASVLPRLVENGCPACHTQGYIRPMVTVYEDALPFLAMGDSAANSAMLYKIANLRRIAPDRPTHAGGQRCANLQAEPCLTIRRWWEIEFGATATGGQHE